MCPLYNWFCFTIDCLQEKAQVQRRKDLDRHCVEQFGRVVNKWQVWHIMGSSDQMKAGYGQEVKGSVYVMDKLR